MKKCPFCAEEIQNKAIKCRYCGEFLPEYDEYLEQEKLKIEEEEKQKNEELIITQDLKRKELELERKKLIKKKQSELYRKKYDKYKGTKKAKISLGIDLSYRGGKDRSYVVPSYSILRVLEEEFCLNFSYCDYPHEAIFNCIDYYTYFHDYFHELFFDKMGRIIQMNLGKNKAELVYNSEGIKEVVFRQDSKDYGSIKRINDMKSLLATQWEGELNDLIQKKCDYQLNFSKRVPNDESYIKCEAREYRDSGDLTVYRFGYSEEVTDGRMWYNEYENIYNDDGTIKRITKLNHRGEPIYFEYINGKISKIYHDIIKKEEREYSNDNLIKIIDKQIPKLFETEIEYDNKNRIKLIHTTEIEKGVFFGKKIVGEITCKINYNDL